MIKDIIFPEVEDIAIAIVQDIEGLEEYDVYLINLKSADIKNVMVVSTGYGLVNDKQIKTSTLRHFFDEVKQHDFIKIEPIQKEVFGLSNEYWLSFHLITNCTISNLFFYPKPW